ncbi:uncharacterized protein LOC129569459 [Sitodiplosis mosellana]|uniref:uncharacterized protein LOC129569459 n=1 Tax=Sitodiplosis mosellana TaxID=263140 RepID=UPI0024442029|nr:uncharacterized protein LOC129569459 [Sitodiplosis mosellana]
MKLFIWNDYSWKLVDQSKWYDKCEFVIVRKLFVQWEKKNGAEVAENEIRQHFMVFGKIESVEASNKYMQSAGASSINTPDIYEAYVTFAQSEDAYNAFIANRHDSNAIKVLPADSWRQPTVQLTRPEDIKFLHDTAHRCHDPNWTRDDVVLCDLVKVSLNDSECFCEFAAATFHVEIDQRSWMKLKTIREMGRPMKARLQCLVLHYSMEPDEKYENAISNDEYFRRVSQVLSTCIGDKYDEMTILGVNAISLKMLHDLAPLLWPLETFTFQAESNASVMYALPAYCPNVDFLLVEANSWDGDCYYQVPKHWPSLSRLVLKGDLKMENDADAAKLCRFFEVNQHLCSVQIELLVDYRLCKAIAKNLKSLESLSFICATYNDVYPILDILPGLTNLSQITITILTVKNELGAMVRCTQRLKQMKHLKTVTLLQNFNPTSTHQDELKKHLDCSVKYHENCECHPSDRVVEFGFNDAEVKLPQDKAVLVAIVNVKDADSLVGSVLQATAIIDTFKRTMQFYPNKIQAIKMDTGDHCKFINICST